nr:MAG TPA_asm: hypothetical protein [Caudoviricetes sp.]
MIWTFQIQVKTHRHIFRFHSRNGTKRSASRSSLQGFRSPSIGRICCRWMHSFPFLLGVILRDLAQERQDMRRDAVLRHISFQHDGAVVSALRRRDHLVARLERQIGAVGVSHARIAAELRLVISDRHIHHRSPPFLGTRVTLTANETSGSCASGSFFSFLRSGSERSQRAKSTAPRMSESSFSSSISRSIRRIVSAIESAPHSANTMVLASPCSPASSIDSSAHLQTILLISSCFSRSLTVISNAILLFSFSVFIVQSQRLERQDLRRHRSVFHVPPESSFPFQEPFHVSLVLRPLKHIRRWESNASAQVVKRGVKHRKVVSSGKHLMQILCEIVLRHLIAPLCPSRRSVRTRCLDLKNSFAPGLAFCQFSIQRGEKPGAVALKQNVKRIILKGVFRVLRHEKNSDGILHFSSALHGFVVSLPDRLPLP